MFNLLKKYDNILDYYLFRGGIKPCQGFIHIFLGLFVMSVLCSFNFQPYMFSNIKFEIIECKYDAVSSNVTIDVVSANH
jgi:hypothetical protein